VTEQCSISKNSCANNVTEQCSIVTSGHLGDSHIAFSEGTASGHSGGMPVYTMQMGHRDYG